MGKEVPVWVEICEQMFVIFSTKLNKSVRDRRENEGEWVCDRKKFSGHIENEFN